MEKDRVSNVPAGPSRSNEGSPSQTPKCAEIQRYLGKKYPPATEYNPLHYYMEAAECFGQLARELELEASGVLTPSETAKPDSAPVKNGNAFRRELAALMNRYSLENGSDTPDYMLADYLIQCLRALDSTVNEREVWYGREKKVPTAGERPEIK